MGQLASIIKLFGEGNSTRLDSMTKIKTLRFISEDNGDDITVRGCALDSGTQTTDTEIIRMSHCGGFYYNDR